MVWSLTLYLILSLCLSLEVFPPGEFFYHFFPRILEENKQRYSDNKLFIYLVIAYLKTFILRYSSFTIFLFNPLFLAVKSHYYSLMWLISHDNLSCCIHWKYMSLKVNITYQICWRKKLKSPRGSLLKLFLLLPQISFKIPIWKILL